MSSHFESAVAMRDKLNLVSPSFCLAKWKQVTIHLQNGQTHSCHHPPTHLIPVEGLDTNPSQLHNTPFKKQERLKMLNGERPSGCQFCWNVEDSPGNHLSDRHLKSADPNWASPNFDDVVSRPWDDDVFPTYLEVSFSHACQMACSYCAPHISSRWMEEARRLGPYPTTTKFGKITLTPLPEDGNPYVDAFWKWWPELYSRLKVFRITGGEPLLTGNTWRVVDHILANRNQDLNFAINSNLSAAPALVEKLVDKIPALAENVAKFSVFTSSDTAGQQAEYIRHGFNYDYWTSNLERIAALPIKNLHLSIMCTFNALSVSRFRAFLNDMARFKRKMGFRFWLDVSYLRFPEHQTVRILPLEFAQRVDALADTAHALGFSDVEVEKIRRISDWMRAPTDADKQAVDRHDFYQFFSEHDRRRGTNFLETFPEMGGFWETCRSTKLPW